MLSRKFQISCVIDEFEFLTRNREFADVRRAIELFFLGSHVEDPIDGTNFDCDVLDALQKSNNTAEAREKLLVLKEKYKDE